MGCTSGLEVCYAEQCLLITAFLALFMCRANLWLSHQGEEAAHASPAICDMSNFVVAGGSLGAAFAGVPRV